MSRSWRPVIRKYTTNPHIPKPPTIAIADQISSNTLYMVTDRRGRGPLKNSGTSAAAHPRRLAPPAMLTWQSHASLSRPARGIHGCTTSVGPTMLQRTLRRAVLVHAAGDHELAHVLAERRLRVRAQTIVGDQHVGLVEPGDRGQPDDPPLGVVGHHHELAGGAHERA